jgi:hypothetical protein
MERRTLTIIVLMLLLLLGVPFIFMWTCATSGSNSRYWQIDNAGLFIISKDSLQSEHYHFSNSKSGLDTSKTLLALIYFDTEYYAEPASNNSMLSAATEPGRGGNTQKITALKIFASDFYKTDYKDVSDFFTNDSTSNYNDQRHVNFQLHKNYHGDIGYHPHVAYLFNNTNHLVYCFNQDNSRFDDIGDDSNFIKFKIDKNLFRQFNRLFKLKLKVELSDKTIERTYFFSFK